MVDSGKLLDEINTIADHISAGHHIDEIYEWTSNVHLRPNFVPSLLQILREPLLKLTSLFISCQVLHNYLVYHATVDFPVFEMLEILLEKIKYAENITIENRQICRCVSYLMVAISYENHLNTATQDYHSHTTSRFIEYLQSMSVMSGKLPFICIILEDIQYERQLYIKHHPTHQLSNTIIVKYKYIIINLFMEYMIQLESSMNTHNSIHQTSYTNTTTTTATTTIFQNIITILNVITSWSTSFSLNKIIHHHFNSTDMNDLMAPNTTMDVTNFTILDYIIFDDVTQRYQYSIFCHKLIMLHSILLSICIQNIPITQYTIIFTLLHHIYEHYIIILYFSIPSQSELLHVTSQHSIYMIIHVLYQLYISLYQVWYTISQVYLRIKATIDQDYTIKTTEIQDSMEDQWILCQNSLLELLGIFLDKHTILILDYSPILINIRQQFLQDHPTLASWISTTLSISMNEDMIPLLFPHIVTLFTSVKSPSLTLICEHITSIHMNISRSDSSQALLASYSLPLITLFYSRILLSTCTVSNDINLDPYSFAYYWLCYIDNIHFFKVNPKIDDEIVDTIENLFELRESSYHTIQAIYQSWSNKNNIHQYIRENYIQQSITCIHMITNIVNIKSTNNILEIPEINKYKEQLRITLYEVEGYLYLYSILFESFIDHMDDEDTSDSDQDDIPLTNMTQDMHIHTQHHNTLAIQVNLLTDTISPTHSPKKLLNDTYMIWLQDIVYLTESIHYIHKHLFYTIVAAGVVSSSSSSTNSSSKMTSSKKSISTMDLSSDKNILSNNNGDHTFIWTLIDENDIYVVYLQYLSLWKYIPQIIKHYQGFIQSTSFQTSGGESISFTLILQWAFEIICTSLSHEFLRSYALDALSNCMEILSTHIQPYTQEFWNYFVTILDNPDMMIYLNSHPQLCKKLYSICSRIILLMSASQDPKSKLLLILQRIGSQITTLNLDIVSILENRNTLGHTEKSLDDIYTNNSYECLYYIRALHGILLGIQQSQHKSMGTVTPVVEMTTYTPPTSPSKYIFIHKVESPRRIISENHFENDNITTIISTFTQFWLGLSQLLWRRLSITLNRFIVYENDIMSEIGDSSKDTYGNSNDSYDSVTTNGIVIKIDDINTLYFQRYISHRTYDMKKIHEMTEIICMTLNYLLEIAPSDYMFQLFYTELGIMSKLMIECHVFIPEMITILKSVIRIFIDIPENQQGIMTKCIKYYTHLSMVLSHMTKMTTLPLNNMSSENLTLMSIKTQGFNDYEIQNDIQMNHETNSSDDQNPDIFYHLSEYIQECLKLMRQLYTIKSNMIIYPVPYRYFAVDDALQASINYAGTQHISPMKTTTFLNAYMDLCQSYFSYENGVLLSTTTSIRLFVSIWSIVLTSPITAINSLSGELPYSSKSGSIDSYYSIKHRSPIFTSQSPGNTGYTLSHIPSSDCIDKPTPPYEHTEFVTIIQKYTPNILLSILKRGLLHYEYFDKQKCHDILDTLFTFFKLYYQHSVSLHVTNEMKEITIKTIIHDFNTMITAIFTQLQDILKIYTSNIHQNKSLSYDIRQTNYDNNNLSAEQYIHNILQRICSHICSYVLSTLQDSSGYTAMMKFDIKSILIEFHNYIKNSTMGE